MNDKELKIRVYKCAVKMLTANSKSRCSTRPGRYTPEHQQHQSSESISSPTCNPCQHRSLLRTCCMASSESTCEPWCRLECPELETWVVRTVTWGAQSETWVVQLETWGEQLKTWGAQLESWGELLETWELVLVQSTELEPSSC